MKKTLLFLVLAVIVSFSFSQSRELSSQSEISILTVGQGDNLSDAFGHSAFRIKDRANNLDITYGYGRYDFDAPNFILKFARGKLNYLIGKRHFKDFFESYHYYDRTIKEQQLNLTLEQKQRLYNFLVTNYKPENRRYLYDFFYDNCATRIRDVVNTVTDKTIKFAPLKETDSKTFRQLIHENVGRNTWGSFGIDIALGSLIDQKASPQEQLFLPEYINKSFENATINNNQNLVKHSKTIYASKQKDDYKTNFLISPVFVMSLVSIFIIFITYLDNLKEKQTRWLDIVIFIITGIAGLILLLLWFGTDHTTTAHNYNLLWAFPLHLFAVFQLFKSETKQWFRSYLKFCLILLCLMSLHWIIGIQSFAIGLLPFLIALITRYAYLIKFHKRT